jgi:adenylate cyclase
MTDITYAQDHLNEIARKSLAADEKLHDLFIEIAGISSNEAYQLVNFYKLKKLVKLDLTNTRLTVKHGALLDKEVIDHIVAHGAF